LKGTLVVIGPTPPPYHGVTISTSLVLANASLREVFDLRHVDTSDKRSGANVGKWEARNMLLAGRALARLRKELRPPRGIVYLPLSQGAAGFMRDSLLIHLAALHGWKVAAHLRGSEFRSLYEKSPVPMRKWIQTTLDRTTSVAVMGESLRWIFEGLVPPERIAVVPNGTPKPSVCARRDDSTVVFLSNLRRRKGVIEAVEAARVVAAEHDDARFVFVGEWEDENLADDLRERVASLDGRIEFKGPLVGARKEALLASAAVLLFPPVEPEGHPRVVIEALAAGVPVVATNRGAIAETIIDGQSGFVLPTADPHLLAAKILLLLRDRDLRVRMSQAATTRYLEAFTQERADQALTSWLGGWSLAAA
jgi:glycosyltransferase involved in cell wall biosynthesis